MLCSVPTEENISHFNEWFDSLLDSPWILNKDKAEIIAKAMITLWWIWKARNARVFEEKVSNPSDILQSILFSFTNYLVPNPNSRNGTVHGIPRRSVANWRAPRGQTIKINSDAHFNVGCGKGSTGIIARNNKGLMVAGCTSNFYAASPLVAEAIALREAINLAAILQIPSILLESDCLILVGVCRGERIR